jgi:hypothetical protein
MLAGAGVADLHKDHYTAIKNKQSGEHGDGDEDDRNIKRMKVVAVDAAGISTTRIASFRVLQSSSTVPADPLIQARGFDRSSSNRDTRVLMGPRNPEGILEAAKLMQQGGNIFYDDFPDEKTAFRVVQHASAHMSTPYVKARNVLDLEDNGRQYLTVDEVHNHDDKSKSSQSLRSLFQRYNAGWMGVEKAWCRDGDWVSYGEAKSPDDNHEIGLVVFVGLVASCVPVVILQKARWKFHSIYDGDSLNIDVRPLFISDEPVVTKLQRAYQEFKLRPADVLSSYVAIPLRRTSSLSALPWEVAVKHGDTHFLSGFALMQPDFSVHPPSLYQTTAWRPTNFWLQPYVLPRY